MPKRLLMLVLLAACARPAPPPPAPAPAEPVFSFSHTSVWSTRPGVELRGESAGGGTVPRAFSRLEVIHADSAGASVRCTHCPEPVEGRVSWADLVYEAGSTAAAAHGSIAEFALAVRAAAERRDLEALRTVMARDFTSSLIGPQSPDTALAGWEAEGFAALDAVPRLLDRGLATRDGVLWAAPGEHLEEHGYQGYRLGFRATPDGRWEWVFLIRGER